MLDYMTVYDSASKREKVVLDKIKGNTLDVLNMTIQLSSFSRNDLDKLENMVELYDSLNQNSGFIEVLDKALKKIKKSFLIIDRVLKESGMKK